jgi:POT family proton-dependent oligopeptide transporter
MVLGQLGYLLLRPRYLAGVGSAPTRTGPATAAHRDQPLTREEWRRITAILIITCMVILFWFAFEQASTSLTSFARERTDLRVAGWLSWAVPSPAASDAPPAIPVEWFQSINPFFVVLLAPLFAILWTALGRRGLEPSVSVRMGVGMLIAAAGYVLMVFAAQHSEPGVDGVARRVSPFWLIGAYLLATCGELCLSPVGLAMIAKLSPARCVSMLMGVWFCAIFVGFLAAGVVGGSLNRIAEAGFILKGQAGFFLLFVIGPGAAGLIMLALSPLLRRLMGEGRPPATGDS